MNPPGFPTLVELLRWRGMDQPGRIAYRFLPDGEVESGRLTYAQADLRARAIGAWLRERGAAGERVVIAYPAQALDRYVTAFLGCLYAGAIAVPCDASRAPASQERLACVLRDARPKFIFGAGIDGVATIDVSDIPDDAASQWQPPGIGPDSLALLQYTSGSTRQPRGVMVSHGNIMDNERAIAAACEHDENSTFVGWLPLFHDMGMIANVLQPVYLGSTSVLMPPAAFLSRPARWLAAISRYSGVTGGGPNFAYDLCAARIGEDERRDLDLSTWRVAFNGAEAVREATLRRFTALFGPHGFAPESFFACYGLAEGTLIVSGAPRRSPPKVLRADQEALRRNEIRPPAADAPGQPLVSSGRPVPGATVTIRDPSTDDPVGAGAIGEICVEGESVAHGYWEDQQSSMGTFGGVAGSGGKRLLRTGDLGALVDGELFVVGRRKDLIVVRGQNHHPSDLEWTAERSHPALRPSCGAAFAIDEGQGERVAIVYETTAAADVEVVASAVRQAIAARHGLHVHTFALADRGAVLKTTSGKVRRSTCRDALAAGRLPLLGISVLPETSDVTTLPSRQELSRVPAADLPRVLADAIARRIGGLTAETAVREAGLDSLQAVEIQHEIQQLYGADLPPMTLLGDRTPTDLALLVLRAGQPASDSAQPHSGPAPIATTARALWFEHQLAPPGPAYVLTRVLRVRGPLDRAALARAVDRLAARHPALRTRFGWDEGQPVQRIQSAPALVLSELDGAEETAVLAAEARRPLSPADGPTARFTLLRRDAEEHLLVLSAHHAVADFWSLVVLVRELKALYAEQAGGPAAELGPSPTTPAEHALREAGLLASPEAGRLWDYWRARLDGAPTLLELPTDRPRPAMRGFQGGIEPIRLDEQTTAALRKIAHERRCTLFTVVLAAYEILLSRLSGQPDLLLGVLDSGRHDAALAGTVGCLVNTIPVRARVTSGEGFSAMVDRVRADLLQDLAHGSYPMPEIVRRLGPKRAPGRSALIQAMLVYQQEQGERDPGLRALALGMPGRLLASGLRLETVPVPQPWTHLDLTLNLAEIDGALVGTFEYDAALFEPATIAGIAKGFGHLLRELGSDPHLPVGRYAITTAAQQRAAIDASTGERRPRPDTSLHGLVWQRLVRAPDSVCVSHPLAEGSSQHLSARAVRRWASSLGARLAELGAGPEHRVGILLDRCLALPVAMLAVLDRGAAYVPLDPADPPQRLAGLIADAGIGIVLTDERHRSLVPEGVVPVDVDAFAGRRLAPTAPAGQVHSEQAAYVIYTSGSTGAPKGVAVPHRGVTNRLMWMQEAMGLRAGDRVLHKTPATFDVSVWELFWPLAYGAALVIGRPGIHRDPHALAETVRREQITVMHMVPSLLPPLAAAARDGFDSLSQLVCSGESLTVAARNRIGPVSRARIWNLYGPTEASIDVTAWADAGSSGAPIPIGPPISNVEVHVLDGGMRPQPANVKGEMFIGGAALARGYLGRPGRTAEAFLPHPSPQSPGARIYRSGDVGLRRPDGALVCLGRVDQQIKLAGNRIELGEVEEALRSVPGVAAAAAAVHDDGSGPRLVGYVVGGQASIADIERQLRAVLPAAHVPAQILTLDRLPTTPNGKLDRHALPVPAQPVHDDRSAGVLTADEQRVAGRWGAVLGTGSVDPDAGFFAVGGDSILALRLVAALNEIGVATTVTDLMAGATVRTLARQASSPPGDRRDGPAPFELCPPAVRAALPEGLEDAYPVSYAQRAVLFRQLEGERHEVYVTSLLLRARLDISAMRRCIAALMARHAYLRSTLDLTMHREPWQLVHAHLEAPLRLLSLREYDPGRQETLIDEHLRAERSTPFDVAKGPLIRFTLHERGAGTFQLTVASFALDGWCTATVLTELLTDYHAELTGRRFDRSPPAASYAGFVAQEQAALRSEASRDFWAAQLAGAEPSRLPLDERVQGTSAGLSRRVTTAIPAEVAQGLDRVAREIGVPLKSVLLAAHARVVRLLTAQRDIVTGLEVNGRPEVPDGDRVVGVFNNIVPLRVRVAGTWSSLVRAIDGTQRRLAVHRRYPLTRLDRDHSARDLFDTLFVYTHFHLYRELSGLDGLQVLAGEAPDRTYVPLTAHFNVDAATGKLRLLLDYDPKQIHDEQARLWADCYAQALRSLAADPERSCLDESPLPAGVWRRQLADGVGAPAATPATVHQLICAQAARTPEAVAVVCGSGHLTYQALLRRSAELAAVLRRCGVGVETLVGLPAARTPDLLVGMLAILRAGGAYLPLDPANPRERSRQLLRESGAKVLLAGPDQADLAPPGCVVVAPDAGEAGFAAVPTPPSGLAYVLPTSGSTGEPKLVGVPHAAVANYLLWSVAEYGAAIGRTPVHSAVSFDLTVTSLLAPLAAGGTVELLPETGALDAALAAGAGLLKITPSHFAALGEQTGLAGDRNALTCVVLGGEPLRRNHLVAWAGRLGADLVNEYGPTEATVGCCTHRLDATGGPDPVPIGRPIAGAKVHVLDEGQLVPDGVAAELAIGGVGVARGYLGRPAATAARFVPDPHGNGERVYLSGDRGRRDRTGVLHYLGRTDRQVKVRGHRVEPAEIERRLCEHPGVAEAVVVLARAGTSRGVLTGYWVGRPGSTATAGGLRRWLESSLPEYMVPELMVRLPALPVNARGKVDVASLPDPLADRRQALAALAATIPDDVARELIDSARAG